MTHFYVAFSKHNSNTFITANKDENIIHPVIRSKVAIDGYNFTVSEPRMGSSLNDGVKLIYNNLNTQDMNAVYSFFSDLKQKGWNVNDGAFIKKHGLNTQTQPTPASASSTVTIAQPETPIAVTENKIVEKKNTVENNNVVATPATNKPAKPLTPRQSVVYEFINKYTVEGKTPVYLDDIKANAKHPTTQASFKPSEINEMLRSMQTNGYVTVDGNTVAIVSK